MKRCNVCGGEKPAEEFSRRTASPDGLSYTCKTCTKRRGAERYRSDPESVKRRAAEWSRANPGRRKEIVAANQGRSLRQRAEQKKRNYEARLEHHRALARSAAYRRRQRVDAADASVQPGLAGRLLRAARGRCCYCGGVFEALTIDHFHPVAQGGGGDAGNVVPCCKPCNSSKRDSDGPAWLEKRLGLEGLIAAYWRIESVKGARLPC